MTQSLNAQYPGFEDLVRFMQLSKCSSDRLNLNLENAPVIRRLELPQESPLLTEGLPRSGAAIAFCWERKEHFQRAHRILQEFIGDIRKVSFRDDPDWDVTPEFGKAMQAAGMEDRCYCLAIDFSKYTWA